MHTIEGVAGPDSTLHPLSGNLFRCGAAGDLRPHCGVTTSQPDTGSNRYPVPTSRRRSTGLIALPAIFVLVCQRCPGGGSSKGYCQMSVIGVALQLCATQGRLNAPSIVRSTL